MGDAADDRGTSLPDPNEPWPQLPRDPAADESFDQAPPKFADRPASVLVVLGRIVLALLAVGVLLISTLIAFFAACFGAAALTANAHPNPGAGLSWLIGLAVGLIAGGVVLVFGVRLLNRLFRRPNRAGGKT